MDMQTLKTLAREKLFPVCRICPVCDGVACRGEIPGLGGVGTGAAFQNNIRFLRDIKLNMRTVHNVTNPDMNTKILGINLTIPIIGAPIGGVAVNLNGMLSEVDYGIAIVNGCKQAGTIAMTGDGGQRDIYSSGLQAIMQADGHGIPTAKPRDNEEILRMAEQAYATGAPAFAIDIDAAVLINMTRVNQAVSGKTLEQLKYLKQNIQLPLIIKGILHPDDALACVEAGIDAIVVSNHGGRVLDSAVSSAEMLPAIKQAVGDKITILADGGIRSGTDVLKMIALGADAVLVGRPLSFGACAASTGVEFMLNKFKTELQAAMIMTGCQDIQTISSKIIFK